MKIVRCDNVEYERLRARNPWPSMSNGLGVAGPWDWRSGIAAESSDRWLAEAAGYETDCPLQ